MRLRFVEDGRQIVVVRNLSGYLLTIELEGVVHKAVTKVNPVDLRIGHMVRIEVTRGTAKLGRTGHAFQQGQLFVQSLNKHFQLFTQTGGRSGLTVGLASIEMSFHSLANSSGCAITSSSKG